MKKAINISFWILLFAGFVTLLGFNTNHHNERLCSGLNFIINGANEHPLINEATLQETLNQNGFRIQGQKTNEISIDEIEEKISQISQVEHAKVFANINGELQIAVEQKVPIARIFNANGGSFYIDEKGEMLALSNLHSARLIAITSDLNLDFSNRSEDQIAIQNQLLDLVKFIRQDSFWVSQIVQIHCDKNKEIELTPRVGNHKIVIGKAINLRTKFDKLWAFYLECEEKQHWNEYSTVNLKFKDQIVCTKK